jgi:hypothetical protein
MDGYNWKRYIIKIMINEQHENMLFIILREEFLIMPQTKFQDFIYTIIMVIIMVYGMVCYNIAINIGEMNNQVFVMALGEMPIMGTLAFLLEFFFIGNLSKKIAFRLVNSKEDKPIFVIIVMSAVIVCLMCPVMSFLGSVFFKFNGIENIISKWLQTWVINFPMALCFQIFYAGPLVRFIFKKKFKQ